VEGKLEDCFVEGKLEDCFVKGKLEDCFVKGKLEDCLGNTCKSSNTKFGQNNKILTEIFVSVLYVFMYL
jgi:hypothetical protein